MREESGRKTYLWKSTSKLPSTPDAAAKKKPESDRPRPDVGLTTFRSWEEVGQWYHALEAPKLEMTDAVRAKAAELTRGLTSREQRLRAIYQYGSTNFRY